MHPSRFSQLLSVDLDVPLGDWRVMKLARLVGVPVTRAFEGGSDLRLCPSPSAAGRAAAPHAAPRDPEGDPAEGRRPQ
jgi:hypothetical protein